MRVRTKIRLLFLSVIGIALLTGGVSLWSISQLGTALGASNASLGTQLRTERLRVLIRDGATEDRIRAAITPEHERLERQKEAYEQYDDFRARAEQKLVELASEVARDPEMSAVVQLIRSSLRKLHQFVTYGREEMQVFGGAERTIRHLNETFLPDLNRYVDQLIASQQNRVGTATERATGSRQRVVALIWVTSGILVVVATLGLALFRRWLLHPVLTLTEATRRISGAHYSETIPIHGKNEFARLAREIESMSRSIAEFQLKLVEKERMAAVGEMTASVAHNVRNPLASIRAIAQSHLRDKDLPVPLREAMATVMETVDRADRWLKDLLTALRPVKLTTRSEELGKILEDIVRGSRIFAERRGVTVELEVDDDLPALLLDRRQIEQAVIVLISNSVEVSSEGSEVRVRAGRDPNGSDRVRIEVEDHGSGMDDETLGKLFTPYFTTKKAGIGLGLCLTQKIVFGHRGTIDVSSAPGDGTRMTVWLPLTASAEDS